MCHGMVVQFCLYKVGISPLQTNSPETLTTYKNMCHAPMIASACDINCCLDNNNIIADKMYKALDKVNYENLTLNQNKSKVKVTPEPQSLVELSCIALTSKCSKKLKKRNSMKNITTIGILDTLVNFLTKMKSSNTYPCLTEQAILSIPAHLSPSLLKSAIKTNQPAAASTIVSNWPLRELCFKEVLSGCNNDIFQDEMGFNLVVFRGIINRTKTCKIRTVDFRGFKLNHTFSKLIIQMWPILSLKKSQLKPKYLAKIIAKTAGVEASKLTEEILPRILNDLLDHEMVKNTRFSIYIPRGERMVVKLDSVQFTTRNTFFMDYLICNCLRSITPVYIAVSNIYIRSDLTSTEEITESLAPFIVLRGQEKENLDGLSLKQLEEGIFFLVSSDIQKFSNLRALDLQDCNIYLQEGRTRSRTSGRLQMVNTLACFSNLLRLDLSFNYLLGCLGELLDALGRPLEFLSVRGCDLNEDDLTALSQSKHAPNLRELNLSKVCQFSIYDNDRISPIYLLKITRHFPNVIIFNLAQNHLPDACVVEFCEVLTQNLTRLKALDISGNILTEDNLIDITKAIGKLKSMQWFRFTCANNLLEEALGPVNAANNIAEMKKKFCDILASVGRDDIMIELVKLSYAIFVDLLDVME